MKISPEFKIIADHLRSSCFLVADGILPSNEGRGYVLRRIMRRAMRQLHKLGKKESAMYKLVDSLIKEMGEAYPELIRGREVIIETLKNEEEKFRETLEKGLKILEEETARTQNKELSGAIAFKLYDTYGFPLDLTSDILKEKGIAVDVEGFNSEMKIQRKRAKENWIGSGEIAEEKVFFELKEKFGETKFLGYETLQAKAKVLAVIQGGIILDQTPFYATSGGQKGDDGKIGNIEISETKKFAGGLFVHFVKAASSLLEDQANALEARWGVHNLKPGDEVEAIVNPKTRQSRAANHSATHLLHKALKEILGNSISQKGSNVDAESFTFDFNFNRSLTEHELERIEDMVNEEIRQNSAVGTKLMTLEKARESGAEALFGEKYEAEVRVVSMGKSIELCGGTHARRTGDIGLFKIISEKGIASGIRRIEAKTGFSAIEFNRKKQKEGEEFLINLHQELKRRDKEIERLKKQIMFSGLSNLKAENLGKTNLLHHVFDETEPKEIREIASEIKSRKEFSTAHIFAFFGCKNGKVSVCIAISSDLLEKFDASKLIIPVVEAIGGKGGGGKKDLAMGGGVNKQSITQAVIALRKLIIL